MKTRKRGTDIHGMLEGRGRGQILALVAIMMAALLIATGLAVDGGFLMLRKAQLDRAVDAAALAGAPLATLTDVTAANVRGQQLLAANGIAIPNVTLDRVPGPGTSVLDFSRCGDGNLPAVGSSVGSPEVPAPNFVAAPIDYYCGQPSPGTMPGAVRYRAVVRWNVPLFFIPLVGINHVPLTADAIAEYYSMVDMYSSEGNLGLVKSATLSFWGPDAHEGFGDPYLPLDSALYSDLNGAYTYRIMIPPADEYTYDNVRIEIFDPDTGNPKANSAGSDVTWFNWSTGASSGYECSSISGDQCSGCQAQMCAAPIPMPVPAPNPPVNPNPFWFHRVDEIRAPDQNYYMYNASDPYSPGSDTPYANNNNVETVFRLFYYRQAADGSLEEIDVAYYLGKRDGDANAAKAAEAQLTDLTWVSPGAPAAERMPAFDAAQLVPGLTAVVEPGTVVENCTTLRTSGTGSWGGSAAVGCSPGDGNFIVDMTSETPGLYVDPGSKRRYLYLQVIPLDGPSGCPSSGRNANCRSGENGYALWAGPARTEQPLVEAPANINARQLYILRQQALGNPTYHSSEGVVVSGMGHINMNQNASNRNEIPLAYLGTEYAGLQMTIGFWDLDVGMVAPVVFYFDTIPQVDWTYCFGTAGQCAAYPGATVRPMPGGFGATNQWANYQFTVPSDSTGVPFYGGRLFVSYQDGTNDTFHIRMTVDGRPVLVG